MDKTGSLSTISHSMKTTIPWVEKYRPTQFEDIVLDPMNRKLFENILHKNYFPNLLFYGPPGTGKTTTIINLIHEFQSRHFHVNKNLIIHLNASDERGIDIIRNQINQFVKTKNLFEIGFKFVILDEVDYMTKNAQQALKYLLQTCPNNVRFCLICNYISKIEESLQNEFISIRFNQLPKKEVYQFIKIISEKEELQMTDETIYKIHDIYGSDIRSIINFIQLNQTLQTEEWKTKVMDIQILETIHQMLQKQCIQECDKQDNTPLKISIRTADETSNLHWYNHNHIQSIIMYIHEISTQYNTDKKTIIRNYVNFIIRNKPQLVTNDFFEIVKNILHHSNVSVEHILNYFCCQFCHFYSTK